MSPQTLVWAQFFLIGFQLTFSPLSIQFYSSLEIAFHIDSLCQKLGRISESLSYICYFDLCHDADGLALVVQHLELEVCPCCLPLGAVDVATVYAGFFSIAFKLFDVFTPSSKKLIAEWKSKGFVSMLSSTMITKASGMTQWKEYVLGKKNT